jgi:hypothetical protein
VGWSGCICCCSFPTVAAAAAAAAVAVLTTGAFPVEVTFFRERTVVDGLRIRFFDAEGAIPVGVGWVDLGDPVMPAISGSPDIVGESIPPAKNKQTNH